ncbi:MAG: AraC family transcriptional regulator [Pseudomonadota bacterium]
MQSELMSDDQKDLAPVDAAGIVSFLETSTASTLSASTLGSDWSGLDAALWEQGDDAFVSPPMTNHFVALCVSGGALADIRFDRLAGPRYSVLKPGMICFMPAGDSADVAAAGRYGTLHVMLSPQVTEAVLAERVKGDPADVPWQGFHGQECNRIADILRTIAKQMQDGASGSKLASDRLAIELAGALVDYASDAQADNGPEADLTPLQFRLAIDFIEANVARDFGLDEIAEQIGVEPLRLVRGFEAAADAPLHHFQTERRLDVLRDWLAGPARHLPTGEIARKAGFSDAAALDAAFRAHVGISFDNYRRGRLG